MVYLIMINSNICVCRSKINVCEYDILIDEYSTVYFVVKK